MWLCLYRPLKQMSRGSSGAVWVCVPTCAFTVGAGATASSLVSAHGPSSTRTTRCHGNPAAAALMVEWSHIISRVKQNVHTHTHAHKVEFGAAERTQDSANGRSAEKENMKLNEWDFVNPLQISSGDKTCSNEKDLEKGDWHEQLLSSLSTCNKHCCLYCMWGWIRISEWSHFLSTWSHPGFYRKTWSAWFGLTFDYTSINM